MKRRQLLLGALAGAVSAACSVPEPQAASITAAADHTLLAIPVAGRWPAAYARASEPAREAYRYAVVSRATLEYIPCYCGCGADGHQSNYDCYVARELGGGRLILDTHGFG